MPYPQEYNLATQTFQNFLSEIAETASLNGNNMAYTITQGVFQVFRRRLSLVQAILFCNLLPAGIRSLFVADWVPTEGQVPFYDRQTLLGEVQMLRHDHNFSFMTKDAIADVGKVLKNFLDEDRLKALLKTFPEGAYQFWYPTA